MKKYIIPHIHVEAINPATILLTSGGGSGDEPQSKKRSASQIYAL